MTLELSDIQKSFGQFIAIKGMNLSLEKGELRALIGPNGAGKSTLLNVITGYYPPDSGKIRFKSVDITGLPPHRICQKGIARSFQITSIFARLSAFENVQVALMARRGRCRNIMTRASRVLRDEVGQLLENVKMGGQARRLAGEMAAGDRKRLEFAMALAGDPELLLLDEPTAGMSPSEKSIVGEVIKEINQHHRVTVVFTEHDFDMVFSIAERITVMHQGVKIAEGSPPEIRGNQRVREVYLGESAHARG